MSLEVKQDCAKAAGQERNTQKSGTRNLDGVRRKAFIGAVLPPAVDFATPYDATEWGGAARAVPNAQYLVPGKIKKKAFDRRGPPQSSLRNRLNRGMEKA
jgi:hypothetical protein